MDKNKNKDKTPSEPRLDADLPVEDESAEQVTGGHSKNPAHSKPAPSKRANFFR
jgi:hypothetical protein